MCPGPSSHDAFPPNGVSVAAPFAAEAPGLADLFAVLEVGMAALLVVGMFIVRARRVRAHLYLQSSVVLLNLPLVGLWMLPRYAAQVLPDLSDEWSGAFYLLPTVALLLGAAAEVRGVYIILVAATTWVPERWRFRNYKRWMRSELLLWWAVVALGLAIYASWYVWPPTS